MGLTFDVITSRDLFKVLLENFEDYKKDKSSVSKAMNCITIGWHLTDWESKRTGEDLGALRDDLYERCEELRIMHDLCNSIKHFRLKRRKSKIRNSNHHKGTFGPTFGPTFNKSYLEIIDEKGDRQDLFGVIRKVVDFWTEYFGDEPINES